MKEKWGRPSPHLLHIKENCQCWLTLLRLELSF